MEMVVNQHTLISSYMRYLTAYGRYYDALQRPEKLHTLQYAKREFEDAHRTLLHDTLPEFGDDSVRVMLPAEGRIDGSRIMDLPQFRFFIDHQQYGTGLFRRNARGEWEPAGDIEMFQHVVELNEEGEGYCLLYEDHVISYLD